MLGEVISFAIILVAFEFVILCMVTPKLRLRLLGNEAAKVSVHMIMLLINMWVHWGTVVGTMSATLSFIVSLGVLAASTRLFGKLVEGRYYTIGLVRYNVEEIK